MVKTTVYDDDDEERVSDVDASVAASAAAKAAFTASFEEMIPGEGGGAEARLARIGTEPGTEPDPGTPGTRAPAPSCTRSSALST